MNERFRLLCTFYSRVQYGVDLEWFGGGGGSGEAESSSKITIHSIYSPFKFP